MLQIRGLPVIVIIGDRFVHRILSNMARFDHSGVIDLLGKRFTYSGGVRGLCWDPKTRGEQERKRKKHLQHLRLSMADWERLCPC
ncbi:hypothetical protein D3C73_964880 [compost metagenome]